jgi:catechol 2,3-dioxygenase-like lactoylglutathione lyase family enzyme
MALHRLASVTLSVPDIDSSVAFFEAFGLTSSTTTSHAGYQLATRDAGDQVFLVRAPWRGIRQIGVAVDDVEDLARVGHRIAAAGYQVDADGASIATTEPVTGIVVTFEVAPRVTPAIAVQHDPVNVPGDARRLNRPAHQISAVEPVRPSSLAHVVIGSPDQPATLSFFTDVLGFEISDELPGIIAFTRCGQSHHNVAIQSAPVAMVHHVAFEVDTIDDVARGGSDLVRADASRQLWGLGRHAIGSNWFWYLREPNGHFVEYTADIDQITSQDLYEPKQWAGHEYLYAAGHPPPAGFLEPDDIQELIAAAHGSTAK